MSEVTDALEMAMEALRKSKYKSHQGSTAWLACKRALENYKPLSDATIRAIDKDIDPKIKLEVGKMMFARAIEQAHGIGKRK